MASYGVRDEPLARDPDPNWCERTICPASRHFAADEMHSWNARLDEVRKAIDLDVLRIRRSGFARDSARAEKGQTSSDIEKANELSRWIAWCESQIKTVTDQGGTASWQERSNSFCTTSCTSIMA